MKISADWLADYVALDGVSPAELAENLTVRTAEVEGFEVVERAVRGLFVGEIVAAEPFDAQGRLRHHVTVDGGPHGAFRTVCGAPNVRVGLKSIFAPPGTHLFGGAAVQVAELYGRRSEGVLCAPGEIGLGSGKEGLVEVPADVPAGTALDTLVAATDTLIEIDNKSLTHRPDLWGHYGFAREVAAILGRPFGPWQADELPAGDDLPAWPVQVDEPDDCPLYTALAFSVRGNRVSPLRMQSRLYALGTTPQSALVDVTNYVQFELGQPTHAFDARSLERVRVAHAGSTVREFTTLDGKCHTLLPHDLLILNGDEPVALAGIMGGQDSKIRPDTTRLVLESATFKASRVRTTSVRLGLRTDSSLRFEKKPPPVYTRMAAGRILRLLREAGLGPQVESRYTAVGDFKDAPRTISLAPGWLAGRAGIALGDDVATGILHGIGLTVQRTPAGGLDVTVPAFRAVSDLATKEDISEEVFRLYGYDNFAPRPPDAPLRPVPPHASSRNQHSSRRVLAQAHGFVEVMTYSWHADDWLAELGYTPPSPLLVRNPITPTRRQMRDTLVPNLLAAAHQNRNHAEQYRYFELGRTFWIDGVGEKREGDQLCAVVVDQSGGAPEGAIRALRSALSDLAAAASLAEPTLTPCDSVPGQPWARKGRCLAVSIGGARVGELGLLPEDVSRKLLNAGHAAFLVLDAAALAGEVFPAPRYVAPAQFPGSWQDFTFVWPVARGYAGLVDVLDRFEHPMATTREFVTVWQGKQSPTANYSFRYLLGITDRTPTQADLDGFRAAFLEFVQREGLALVG